MKTYVVVALLGVIWLIIIAMGHRRYVALTFAGVIVLICVARAWLDVRRGPPSVRIRRAGGGTSKRPPIA
jgi:hypothetical protein